MPKPTSPQPPGLTEDEIDALVEAGRGNGEVLVCLAYAAGCEAQRRVDAKNRIYERCLDEMHAENDGEICSKCLMAAIRIERTPEQPTTQWEARCGMCNRLKHQRDFAMAESPYQDVCPDPFHSQPTTGEAGDER